MILRAAFVGVVGALALLGSATPAEAHTRTDETTNIDSRITAAPALDGVEWTVHTGGQLVEVRNASGQELLVYGYDGEPYLRIGPDGVHRNRRSPATFLNDDRYGEVAIPPTVDAAAEPDWRRVADEPRWLWHDHRTHWMSPEPPAFVEAGPLSRLLMRAELVGPIGTAEEGAGVFATWVLPFSHGGVDLTLEGELVWVPAPSPTPWLVGGLAFAVVAAVPVLRARRRGADPVPSAALVVAAVAALGATSLVDDLFAWPEDLLDDLFGLLHTGLFLGVGLAGAAWARYGRGGRRLALGVGSGAVLYHQGLVHLPLLLASRFPTVWPPGLIRGTVALALAQGVVVVLVLAISRPPPGVGSAQAGSPAVAEETWQGGSAPVDDQPAARVLDDRPELPARAGKSLDDL